MLLTLNKEKGFVTSQVVSQSWMCNLVCDVENWNLQTHYVEYMSEKFAHLKFTKNTFILRERTTVKEETCWVQQFNFMVLYSKERMFLTS